MRDIKKIFIAILLVMIALLVVMFIQESHRIEVNNKYQSLVLRYSVQVKNTSNRALTNAEVSIFAPLDLPQQQLVQLTAQPNSNMQLEQPIGKKKEYSNVTFMFSLIPPFGEKNVMLTAELKVLPEPHDLINHPNDFLVDGEYLQLGSKELREVIKEFSGKDKKELPKLVYDWVLQNIQYAGYIQEDRGALYALKTRSGDCTEYMYLMMALLRVNGIPARGLAGFFVDKPESVVSAAGYHNWVEYYDGNVWRIMDPLNNRFNEGYGHYIVLREININNEKNGLSSQRFVSHDPRLVVNMR